MPSFLKQPLVTIPDALSPEVCEELIHIGKNTQLSHGAIGAADTPTFEQNSRKSVISWIPDNCALQNGMEIQKDIMWPLANQVNDDYFGFDLTWHEANQFTTYTAPDEHYDWHCDGHFELYGENETPTPHPDAKGLYRKLSYSVILSHPDDSEGGDFSWIDFTSLNPQMDWGLIENTVPASARNQGTVIFFPSFMYHKVGRVSRGTRHSLVGWISGPRFK